mgnify:CR=1 FL=1
MKYKHSCQLLSLSHTFTLFLSISLSLFFFIEKTWSLTETFNYKTMCVTISRIFLYTIKDTSFLALRACFFYVCLSFFVDMSLCLFLLFISLFSCSIYCSMQICPRLPVCLFVSLSVCFSVAVLWTVCACCSTICFSIE